MQQHQGQYQVQTEAQLLKLSPLQLMTTKLLELPIVELEQRVKDEAIDNVTLETGRGDEEYGRGEEDFGRGEEDFGRGEENMSVGNEDLGRGEEDLGRGDEGMERGDGDMSRENEEMGYGEREMSRGDEEMGYGDDDTGREEEATEYSEGVESREFDDDAFFDSDGLSAYGQGSRGDIPEYSASETASFVDSLMEQLVDFDLSVHQRTLVEYLINSLDDNGFLETPLRRISDEMLFQHNIEADEEELEEALATLQQFDPAGIGARDTRECLLLQIDRKMNDKEHLLGDKYFLLEDGRRIIADHYDLFVNNNTEKLGRILGMSATRIGLVFDELKKLNLHPGLALTESARDRVQAAVPDFIVETDENGHISLHLNNGELPAMHINREYVKQLKAYEQSERKLSRSEQDFVTYTRSKIDSARLFIEAVRQRNDTLMRTMRAIIDLQRQFFLTQDPDDLKPLILKDVAERAGYDISTVSRVRNSKYCMVDGRIYPLSHFFKHTRSNAQGEAVDAERVKSLMEQLIRDEDKSAPLSDGQIAEALTKLGVNIKRRTVAKYRDEMGVPPLQKRLSL